MGFVRDLAQVGTFGLAGLALSKNKKQTTPSPIMISGAPTARPTSMIGSGRGGY